MNEEYAQQIANMSYQGQAADNEAIGMGFNNAAEADAYMAQRSGPTDPMMSDEDMALVQQYGLQSQGELDALKKELAQGQREQAIAAGIIGATTPAFGGLISRWLGLFEDK